MKIKLQTKYIEIKEEILRAIDKYEYVVFEKELKTGIEKNYNETGRFHQKNFPVSLMTHENLLKRFNQLKSEDIPEFEILAQITPLAYTHLFFILDIEDKNLTSLYNVLSQVEKDLLHASLNKEGVSCFFSKKIIIAFSKDIL